MDTPGPPAYSMRAFHQIQREAGQDLQSNDSNDSEVEVRIK